MSREVLDSIAVILSLALWLPENHPVLSNGPLGVVHNVACVCCVNPHVYNIMMGVCRHVDVQLLDVIQLLTLN